MRALRVVGLTEDGEVVLEDPVRLERFRVPADERLRAAARGDLSRLGQIAIELESQLRPREIQARIRAGASVEQVAAAAGVPEQKIERFAYPVLTERFRTAENAQRAHPMRADGPDNRTLAEVVAHTFGLRGQAYEGARWDSWKGEDGRWVVALGWRAGRSDNRAHWTFQPGAHGGTVTALDEHASDLVEGLPARPLRTVGAVVDMTRPEEEPPPAPSPVEQWRAAASDSYRDRVMPTAGGAPRPSRGPAAAAPRQAGRGPPPVERRPSGTATPERPAAHAGGTGRAAGGAGDGGRPAAEPRPRSGGDGGAAGAEWARGGGTARRAAAAERLRDRRPYARTATRAARGPDRRRDRRRAGRSPAPLRSAPSAARPPRPRSGVRHAGDVDPSAPQAVEQRRPTRPRPRATRAHAEPAPAGPADRGTDDQPRWGRLRPTGRDRGTRDHSTRARARAAPDRAGGVDAGRPDAQPSGPPPPSRPPADGARARGARATSPRPPRPPPRPPHAQGQAGHAVVGRGAPGGPRTPLSPLIAIED